VTYVHYNVIMSDIRGNLCRLFCLKMQNGYSFSGTFPHFCYQFCLIGGIKGSGLYVWLGLVGL